MSKEAEKLEKDIEHLENELETAKRVKEIVERLEDECYVSVFSRPDSSEVVIDVLAEEVLDDMTILQELSDAGGRIEYKHEEDQFTLKAKFRF